MSTPVRPTGLSGPEMFEWENTLTPEERMALGRSEVAEFERRTEDLRRADALDVAYRQAAEAEREFNSPEQRSARVRAGIHRLLARGAR